MSQLVPRGVKKMSELTLQKGRALILTEEDASKLEWDDIPEGSIKINVHNGIMCQKLAGQSDWVPAAIKNDGTICIAKDSVITQELFTITELPKWIDDRKNDPTMTPHYLTEVNGLAHFKYTNSKGEQRVSTITNRGRTLNFSVEDGSYMKDRNHLEVVIDGVLTRTKSNGGLIENSEQSFGLTERLEVGQTISAKYIRIFRIGNPYPRVFMTAEAPTSAEVGDLWIDYDETVESADELIGEKETESTISWDRITGKPTSLSGFGDTSGVSTAGHHHKVADIDDFPLWLLNQTNAIDADTLKGHQPGTGPNNVLVLDSSGRIPANVTVNHTHGIEDLTCFHIGVNPPDNPVNNKTVWFCTAGGSSSVNVYTNNRWMRLGAGWES